MLRRFIFTEGITSPEGGFNSSRAASNGSLGTGAVIRPDAAVAAKMWKRSGGLSKPEWIEYAKRIGVFPDDVEKGWASLRNSKPEPKVNDTASVPAQAKDLADYSVDDILSRLRVGESLAHLKLCLGEATSWGGYSVPNLAMMNMPTSPASNFGFHTKSAENVWVAAQRIAEENPKMQTTEILTKAVDAADSVLHELTPEDIKMLEMAINWYLAGKITGMQDVTPPYGGNKTAGVRADSTSDSRG